MTGLDYPWYLELLTHMELDDNVKIISSKYPYTEEVLQGLHSPYKKYKSRVLSSDDKVAFDYLMMDFCEY